MRKLNHICNLYASYRYTLHIFGIFDCANKFSTIYFCLHILCVFTEIVRLYRYVDGEIEQEHTGLEDLKRRMNAINDVDRTTCAQFLDFWPQKEGKEDNAQS